MKESLGREKKQQKELDATKSKAYADPLTGVKSKNAYAEASEALQRSVVNGEKPEFAIIVFDVNDLKKVNDFYGHDAGDRHILSANKMICDGFKHSPVYRIGGDEFVVILTGEDYENGIELLQSFDRQVENNLRNGLTVVSAGYARFDPESDASFSDVFKRADECISASVTSKVTEQESFLLNRLPMLPLSMIAARLQRFHRRVLYPVNRKKRTIQTKIPSLLRAAAFRFMRTVMSHQIS